MPRSLNLITAAVISIAMLSCSSGVEDDCSVDAQLHWVNDAMHDYYLFADQVRDVNPLQYDSPEALLAALRVQPFDRFSSLVDEQRYTQRFDEGMNFGFGFLLLLENDGRRRFSFIEPGSPMASSGIRRGDELLAMNGVPLAEQTQATLDAALGQGNEVITTRFRIADIEGNVREVDVTRGSYSIQSVSGLQVIDRGAQRVGYFVFSTFVDTSLQEIDQAIETLREQGITDLVLDMRYNGGGRVHVARYLASRLIGGIGGNTVFMDRRFNLEYSEFNDVDTFESFDDGNTLDLNRLFVLSGAGTCSASELVINGLAPLIEVITVGQNTCGKPYGTRADVRCGKALNALMVSFGNAAGVRDYYNGLSATCQVEENLDQALGDPEETLLASALNLANGGYCDSVPSLADAPQAAAAMPRGKPEERTVDALLAEAFENSR